MRIRRRVADLRRTRFASMAFSVLPAPSASRFISAIAMVRGAVSEQRRGRETHWITTRTRVRGANSGAGDPPRAPRRSARGRGEATQGGGGAFRSLDSGQRGSLDGRTD